MADSGKSRRAAAKKASKVSARQPSSSPAPSDREGDARSFGEPTTIRSPVRVTYGGKNRHRHSPKKAEPTATRSPQSQSHTRPRKLRTSSQPRSQPRRSAQLRRSVTASEHPLFGGRLTPLTDSDDELTPLSTDSDNPSPVQASTGQSDAMQSDATQSDAPQTTPFSHTRSRPVTTESSRQVTSGAKRALPVSSNSSSHAEAFSVSSSLSSPPPSILTSNSQSRSMHESTSIGRAPKTIPAAANGSSSVIDLTSSSGKRVPSTGTANGHSGNDEENWSLRTIGMHAWVKLDNEGDIVESDSSEAAGDFLWWPAQIIQGNAPVQVLLFGDAPLRSTATQQSIRSPSSANILPMALGGVLRFNETNFREVVPRGGAPRSPKKRQKLDIEIRWKAARDLMLKADEEENDGLPMILSSYIGKSTSTSPRKQARGNNVSPSKGKRKAPASDSEVPKHRKQRALSCDPTYEIPGELVLAKEKPNLTDYWPAQLVEYVEPTERKPTPRYKVQFFDGVVKVIEQDMFFTTFDRGFKTCKLGRDRYNYGMNDDKDESMDITNDYLVKMDVDDESTLRAPSPSPDLPPPANFAHALSIVEQYAYVRPVLAATIAGEYEPANRRHDAFMRGAAARRDVCDSGYARGSLRAREVEEVLRLVVQWARRRERRRELDIPVGASAGEGGVSRSRPADPPAARHLDVQDQTEPADQRIRNDSPPLSQASPSDTEPPVRPEAPQTALINGENGTNEVCDPRVIVDPHPGITQRHISNSEPLADAADGDVGLRDTQAVSAGPRGPNETASNPIQDAPEKGVAFSLPDMAPENTERARPRLTYQELSKVDQLTYCQNILLNEAVLQLLLWRSGLRTSYDLLTPEEEQRLHDVAVTKAEESDWVQDIIRLKWAAEGTMIPSQGKDADKLTPVTSGGTRSRPRRA